MLTVPINYPWHVCTPTVFRYLPAEYVDAFFVDGSLRLSSFRMFKQHADEQRLDKREGDTMFVHRTSQNGGQTISAWASHGKTAYVLCGTMRHEQSLMERFGCDSYIRINDPTKFGIVIARHIPTFRVGAEGPCLYQENKIIERDLGYIDIQRFSDPGDPGSISKTMMNRFVNDAMEHFPFFLKDSQFSAQVEYRHVWMTSTQVEDFLHIRVPEAIQYCSKPSWITERMSCG